MKPLQVGGAMARLYKHIALAVSKASETPAAIISMTVAVTLVAYALACWVESGP